MPSGGPVSSRTGAKKRGKGQKGRKRKGQKGKEGAHDCHIVVPSILSLVILSICSMFIRSFSFIFLISSLDFARPFHFFTHFIFFFFFCRSDQFEARLVTVRLEKQEGAHASIFFSSMSGSRIPIANSHGEGRALFASAEDEEACQAQVAARYVDNRGQPTQHFPLNANGSPRAVASVTAANGRVTAIMPHPERMLRNANFSYAPKATGGPMLEDGSDESPWMAMFYSARRWVG